MTGGNDVTIQLADSIPSIRLSPSAAAHQFACLPPFLITDPDSTNERIQFRQATGCCAPQLIVLLSLHQHYGDVSQTLILLV